MAVLQKAEQSMTRLSFAIRILFACCLLVATTNHIRADFQHGLFWDYGYGPSTLWASRIFWAALTFLDPLAALLLFIKPRAGIFLTAAIILADVAHNTYYVALNHQWLELFYLSQVAFLIAVVLLSPVVWRKAPAPSP
jgi:hypothetical protein